MRPLGIALRDFAVVPGTPDELVIAATELGVTVVHLNPARWVGERLDPAELEKVGRVFAAAGLQVTVDLGAVNPAYQRSPDPLDPDGTSARRRLLREAALLGAESVHVRVGSPESRDDPAVPWTDQLDGARRALADLGPLSLELGIPVVLKTHEEMSSHEALALAEAAGEHVRIGFSAVNLLVCLEDPAAAAERLSGRVHTVFLDDAALSWSRAGMVRRMRPVGAGIVDWPALLTVLPADAPLVFDMHRAELDAPCYRPGWVAARPTLAVEEILALAAAALPDAPTTVLDERRDTGLSMLPLLAAVR
ncbi:sugar phosphate isomerase/epimerase family protein [Nocardia jiangxiensis]|uniref:Sugar phosphate isomerase/epimerase family protein n=1 Tax=Nocardia jiangxiensis TaxID=282685 RepID=A0ABW6RTP3_9NOCA|nr:TIM barrel protein [Nocardia jiangxiensis]